MRWGAHRFRSWVSSRKTHHRASAEGPSATLSSQHRSQSVFFTIHTPSRQFWRGRRIAHSILAWRQDCPKNPSPGQRRRQRCCPRSIADRVFFHHSHAPAVNPGVATGLLHPILLWQHPILLWQQDCSTQSCCATGLPRCTTSSSGLELFLPKGKCKEGQRRCTGAPGRAERVDKPARPGAARSHCTVAADAARCSVPAAAAVREPTFPSCCAAERTRGPPGTASARPAEGARSRIACPPCAPPGAARSAGRPGLASSSSGAGLRRA